MVLSLKSHLFDNGDSVQGISTGASKLLKIDLFGLRGIRMNLVISTKTLPPWCIGYCKTITCGNYLGDLGYRSLSKSWFRHSNIFDIPWKPWFILGSARFWCPPKNWVYYGMAKGSVHNKLSFDVFIFWATFMRYGLHPFQHWAYSNLKFSRNTKIEI
jgi:hypothetical protein